MEISSNYQYILERIPLLSGANGRILDYGCGKGTLVVEGLRRGFPIFGCEVFGSGSGVGIRERLIEQELLGTKVFEIQEGKVPFPDAYFDLVVSNEVFEHVPDLDQVCAEISRILKPSGRLLCVFPVQECYRDHAGTLIAHWFPKNSKAQYYSLLFFRSLGFGRLKKGRGQPREWAMFFVKWLAENTFYRAIKDVDRLFEKYFLETRHIEDDYIHFRLQKKGLYRFSKLLNYRPGKIFSRQFCNKWGGVVMLAEKSRHS